MRSIETLLAGLAMPLLLAAQSGSGGLTAGDPAAGKAVFHGRGGCLQCHTIDEKGGALGPDLSEIGVFRLPEELRLAITDPDEDISYDYYTVTVIDEHGRETRGVRINEDDHSIQLRDTGQNARSFVKERVREMRREPRSLMPSFAGKLSASDVDHLVAYLTTLKGSIAGEPLARTRPAAPVSENLEWLTRPERDGEELPEEVLDFLQIPEGATVADVGAGAGYFTWRLARRVGSNGKVWAVEVQPDMLERLAKDVKSRALTNVELVLGSDRDPRLPEDAVDLVLLANAYHEFAEPETMLAALHRALKRNGRLVVLEYRKEDFYGPLPGLHKMSIEELRSEIEPAGFQPEQILQFLPLQHLLVFSKRPAAAR